MEIIKELRVQMNTGTQGLNSFTSEKINGCLKSLIIKNEMPLDISIISTEGYIIYEEMQRFGVDYFSLLSLSKDTEGHRKNFMGDDFYLNENLIFAVTGSPNQDIEIVIRYI